MAMRKGVFAVTVVLASVMLLVCATVASAASAPVSGRLHRQPVEPLYVGGYVYETDGVTPVASCAVNVTDKNTGEWILTMTDETYGWYQLAFYGVSTGDVVNVTAAKDLRIGWKESVTPAASGYFQVDVTISVPQISFSLNLVAGWNFMSVPLVDTGYKASTLGLLPGDILARFDSETQTFKSWTPGSPPFRDFAILPGEGYWFYSSAAKTLVLKGSAPTGIQTKTITVPAMGGWAAFGLVSLKTTYKASNVPAWYSSVSVTIVARYDPTMMWYPIWIPGGPPFKDFSLMPGQGYWIYVTHSGTLSYQA